MTHTDLTGVLVALVTPFTADGSEIDAAVLEAHVDRLIREGAHGRTFHRAAWISALLVRPAGRYVHHLAAVNCATNDMALLDDYQQRFLARVPMRCRLSNSLIVGNLSSSFP